MPPLCPPKHGWEFPTSQRKAELRSRPHQSWDNGALCPPNQSCSRRAKGRWGPNCLYQGKPCLPEPHPDPVPSENPVDAGQRPRWPTLAGRHRVHQADNASPSMALCAGFPSGQKEGTISGACFLLGGYGGSGIAPARLRALGFRPEPLKKDRDLGMAQEPVLVSCTLWQR